MVNLVIDFSFKIVKKLQKTKWAKKATTLAAL